ncbi:hypothetical protein Tco_0570400 [Tanacetum coccineum]
MTKISDEHAMEPKKVIQALEDHVDRAMQEELYISTSERIGCAPVARIEAIGYFWPYAHYGFIVVPDGCKECFLSGTIDEEAHRAWYGNFVIFIENRFRRGTMIRSFVHQEGQRVDAQEILDEFYGGTHFLLRTSSTPMEPNKALIKDEEADSVDVHFYRSMIGSLMYLTASRPDITFVVCACARFQVTPKTSHLHAVKRIFRYLKGQSKLGLWYLRDSPFDLEAFSDIANSATEAEYVAAANCCGQFWQTASTSTLEDGEVEITATIDSQLKTITEASLRRHLKLEDADGSFDLVFLDIAILSGADNRSPMLENIWYDTWKSRMALYHDGIANMAMILESVENDPLIWPSIEENRVTRPKKYSELLRKQFKLIVITGTNYHSPRGLPPGL